MRVRVKWIIAGLAMLAVSLLIWQRKLAGGGTSDEPEVRSLEEFCRATPDYTASQLELFQAGNRLYLLGDTEGAHGVFDHLLQELPGNEAVEHNFKLSE